MRELGIATWTGAVLDTAMRTGDQMSVRMLISEAHREGWNAAIAECIAKDVASPLAALLKDPVEAPPAAAKETT